jgi:chemotaxis protein methyltransferase WspC
LDLAREFADSGKLIEAESICVDYLEKNKQDSEVYYLLGIIQLALGDEQKSAKYFKNVIYLDPEHYDALMYLATLLGDEGDDIAATRFRERAARIKTRLSKVH